MSQDLYDQAKALEAAVEGIHNARMHHRIIATFATKADSQMLARAAFDALEAYGFKIVHDQKD